MQTVIVTIDPTIPEDEGVLQRDIPGVVATAFGDQLRVPGTNVRRYEVEVARNKLTGFDAVVAAGAGGHPKRP